jgi:autotransporter passenger strand-loop-strand repeat protein
LVLVGEQDVFGSATNVEVDFGGSPVVESGGLASGTTVNGGEQDVFGAASGATVFAGSQVVESGGIASGTTINSGGLEVVSANGFDVGALINSGGDQDVSGGALAIDDQQWWHCDCQGHDH